MLTLFYFSWGRINPPWSLKSATRFVRPQNIIFYLKCLNMSCLHMFWFFCSFHKIQQCCNTAHSWSELINLIYTQKYFRYVSRENSVRLFPLRAVERVVLSLSEFHLESGTRDANGIFRIFWLKDFSTIKTILASYSLNIMVPNLVWLLVNFPFWKFPYWNLVTGFNYRWQVISVSNTG